MFVPWEPRAWRCSHLSEGRSSLHTAGAQQTLPGFRLPPQLPKESTKTPNSTSAHPNYCTHTEQSEQDEPRADFVPREVTRVIVLPRDFAKRFVGTSPEMFRPPGASLPWNSKPTGNGRGHFPPCNAPRPFLKLSPVLPSPRDGHQTSLLCSGSLWDPKLLSFGPG